MFEAHVLHLLRRYLGEYVHGLSSEALRISVWKGDVVLKDLKLKAEALNSLKLPVTVKSGFVGTITLKVPWKRLGKEPVIVLIDRVFLLAHPAPDGRSVKEEDREKLFEVKLQQIEEAEAATLEAVSKSKLGNQAAGSSWLGSLIATVLGNLKISISNVHIRYEDSVSNPGNPFACGITLAKLAAVTMDEKGNETFDTSGALDKLRKSLHLERLAMYHDSNRSPWKLKKKWEDLSPKEWVEVFEDGINESSKGNAMVSTWAKDRTYVVSPINGVLKYHRLGNQERNNPDVAFENASLTVSDVSVTITEAQYHDWIRLMEVISRYKAYVDIFHLRPAVPVSEGPALWWRFAAQASLQQKKLCYQFSWDQIKLMCHLRRRYIQLYAASLQQLSNVDNSQIRNIEKDLDPKVILLWRFLAHAKVESVKSKEAAEQRMQQKSSWFSFRWSTPEEDNSDGPELMEERLTKEEWHAINDLLSYQPNEDSTVTSGKDMQNMTLYMINVSIGQASARIINFTKTEIVSGRFEQLHVSTKFKQRSTHYDVKLKFYGFSVPEGSLAQSVSSEQKENALAASFVQSPIGENLDWSLSATTSPCHVTVFMESYNRVLEFMKRSNAVSPTVALETATALQNKIEKVTRKAQEQFQQVLEEQSRFALDIDLDAPKVRVPLRRDASAICDSHFLLDLGHFTLQTKEDQQGDLGKSLYSRFYISVKDIAALFTDCGSQSQTCTLASATYHSQPPILEDSKNLYSLIDRCGMAVIIDRIKIPSARHPSTRVSVQVPTLGIQFSNARFCRLMDLINILCGTMHMDSQPVVDEPLPLLVPWLPADLSSEARVLVWKGIGYTVAAWQPCFLVLSGLHLYVLESEASYSYQRCSRMAGKQVFEVPPTNVGGSPHCIAVSVRGMDYQKALESFSTLLLKFRDEEEKGTWLRRLTQSTYKASAPSSVDILGEPSDDVGEFAGARAVNLLGADLVVSGTLVEMKLLLYGKVEDELHEELEETLLIELVASGGKVRVVSSEGDLAVKVKLHSLKIKDELQRTLSLKPQYLACSVLKNEHSSASDSTSNRLREEFEAVATEEDDIFEEALPDFMSLPDSTDPQSLESDLGTGRSISADVFYEAQDTDDSDFVSLIYVTRASSSPDYDGIDTQMSIRMSKLEFFCNRPTLVALIGFGLNLGSGNSELPDGKSELPETDVRKNSSEGSPLIKENAEVHEQAIVSGLLGYGKRRITFNLNMNFDSVTIFLNKEDGSQLAMFVQEHFVLDLKVHPSSISIEGTLGNMRLCDLSLGAEHRWGWLCDIRNQGSESLIQFKFNSYSAQDDDYEGYDYSLHGRLSAVRIVFLYKFVQEISTYFMGLAAPHTEEAVKFVDKVGGIEWLIEKYEVDGAAALKLDLALDTPIIIVPLNSTSNDFMQLDLGYLRVTNEVSWHGIPDTDPSAVHLDVLDAEIIGMNLAVGINGSLGKPIVRENENIHVYVRRSLRDVFRKIPTFQLEVKVGLLHAVMSDKEYNIILSSVVTNLNEPPNLPPNFRGSKPGSKDTIKLLADKVNLHSQVFLSRTVTIMAVDVNYALLELCNGVHEESLLARLVLEGLWVSYRMTSLSEADLYITIPRFSIVDIRPGTKPEMHLMLGSCTDVPKQDKGGFIKTDSESTSGRDTTSSTMFLMDFRWRLTSQSWVFRLQQPRVLVVPDFLLAVGEFFVPSLGAITGREEMMDPKNDPIGRNNCVVLSAPLYKQEEDVIKLSPVRQLVADALGIDEYTYDGCGKTICLCEEKEDKEGHSFRFQPIIIIGRAKKLRFVNVKIENGSLLKKYTYLSNDSSYSVSADDGVEIILLDESLDSGDGKNADYMEEVSGTLDSTDEVHNGPGQMQAFNFEAQVISPEFTFYDTSKSSLDDSSLGEKLLRVKTDFGFMYASKENDTWVRAHLKDLSVEADSGLIILDPVDISGGYASVKDKINMSLTSTDIYIRLSLSVISLFLNLQSQAAEAFQFGDADFLSPCTNFDRLWVSPKENGHLNNLTFWRPRAASKYVILGDCVTSRPIPPSIAVMAVSSAYGRVRKPLGFKFIGLFSDIQGNGVRGGSDTDCSIWLPVAPPGYLALGCVAHIGTQPPPNHVVHCIRSDLVTSTTHSECIFSAPINPSLQSGFTVWRLDNFLGSFYAHPSAGPPPRESCFDLNHLVLWNSSQLLSSSKDPSSDLTADLESAYQQRSDQGATSSGWDILRSVTKATSCYMSTPNFERIWWDRGGDLRRPVSIWRPIPRPGYAILGDCITEGVEPPALGIIFKCDNPEISARPVQFTRVAHIVRKGLDEAFFWFPIAPPGYAPMGCVVTRVDEPPHRNSICCPRMDLVNQANIIDIPISRSSSSKSSQCWSLWRVENQGCTFLARSDLKKPSSRLAYTIGDSVKPKTRDNVTVDMKLRCISVTILDSLCGMMTPLFDATITNLKLATHGRLDDMNAVLIASLAASTFNAQLEAWEPLVEPLDGIFKFETYDTSGHPPARLVKRARIAVTSIMNMNISAANLDCFAETIISWRRHIELEQKAITLNEDESTLRECGDSSTLSALDEDDSQMVILENKLGCDIYVKIVDQNSNKVGLVHHNDSSSLRIPPPRYSDRLNVADASREARHYVGVQIFEARELSITDDGNSHDFFCALRLLVNSQQANQQKLFPQSARTKCVRPLISKVNDREKGSARWNELFIFEVPHKGLAKLEVEVTNLGAKAGKGEVVGACSFMVGHGENTLKKVASIRMLHQASDTRGIVTYSLKGVNKDDENPRGCLVASTSYFERKTVANFQSDAEDEHDIERDLGFWIGLSPEGAWEGFRSFLPLSVITKTLRDDFIAMEVVMINGKKHAILRGLATVANDSDVKLDISICPGSMSQSSGSSSERGDCRTVIEEVFENQRFQMGNKRTAFRGNDPGRWSTRDYSYSSKDFFEPPLTSGWTWASSWIIDKSEFVDSDGWAYGPDYLSLKWPLTSTKSGLKSAADAVRRRRWIRTRQQVIDLSDVNNVADALTPGSSATLPWKSMSKESDNILQVRPCRGGSNQSYNWGRPVTLFPYAFGKDQPLSSPDSSSLSRQSTFKLSNRVPEEASLSRQSTLKQANKVQVSSFKLNQLEKSDMLLCCSGTGSKQFWLSISTDASALHTELNAPVYDWKLSVNSPLKLENRLPCPAEFKIWERTKEGNGVERESGIISSRGTMHAYSADIRNPLYLTLRVQGCWVLEKDPVLILDLSSNNHLSSFWMVHQQRRRRLRVSVEHDMGGTIGAPKTIRFFVPYWINNDCSLSLAYRVVEIEPSSEGGDAKSAKIARVPPSPGRNVQILESIEDTSPIPSMFSPQEYVGRGGVNLFSSRNDAYLSPRVGIAVAVRNSENYSTGVSLLELERKQRVDVKACTSDGYYYKLSALLNMTSDRTKVVHFQPQTLFVNRVGCTLCLQQFDTDLLEKIHPSDPPKYFRWQSSKFELLKVRVDGYRWSKPFSLGTEGVMCIYLRNETTYALMHLRVEVRGGTRSSRYEVIFRPISYSSPYRIENRSMLLPVHFRQIDGAHDSWKSLLPNASASFMWEDLGRKRVLEILVDGTDPQKSLKYDIDEINDHLPTYTAGGPPARALRVTVLKEEKVNVVKITDWMPENEPPTIRRMPSSASEISINDSQIQHHHHQQQPSTSNCEFHVIIEIAELGISVIDHTPEEILYLSVQSLLLSSSTGLGSGISRFKFRMRGIQVDNQLPLTPMPVLFRPQRVGEESDYILKLSVTQQSNGSVDLCVYPYIGIQGPENSAFLISVHEPIIWRIHGMMQHANLSRLYSDTETDVAVSVDPIIQISVLNISEIRFKFSMAMSPTQRPVGVLGFWSSLMTALGNTENMPIRINQRFQERVSMRQSVLTSNTISNIKKDLLSQPLQLLSGVDILGNASSALGHMSKGVAALSMDKKFIQSRQRQENKGVEDFGDVIREGGGALAKGLFRGVTGILTKPLEGAKASGVEGFVQGVGKGIIGAAAQPVSGVLDLLSKTTEGANAMRMKIAAAIASEDQLLRRRLPRVIGGDNLLRPYDSYSAEGQVILQLAETGSFVDLFKVRGKFALSDAYEDHFLLPKGRVLVVTHRRILLLQQPSNIIGQKKFNPARDPCSVTWDVLWDDLVTMEFSHGKKDRPNAPYSRLILYLKTRSVEGKDHTRVIKCARDSNQAVEVYSSIEQAMNTYGPRKPKGGLKRNVTKPYSAIPEAGSCPDVNPRDGISNWSPQQQMTGSVSPDSTFSSNP